MPTAQIPGRDGHPPLDIHYRIGGSGPPLLHVNGTGGDLRKPMGPLTSPLLDRSTVLAYDQRGLGQSGRPDRPYSMADYGDDAAALLDHVGWDRVRVVGVSFGGMVAQHLAIRHPERVERLVLCCTSSGGEGGASFPLHELDGLPADEMIVRRLELSDVRRDAAWRRDHPAELAEIVAMMSASEAVGAGEPGRAEGARRQLEARRQHDTWDELPRLSVPTLVAGGRYDAIAPPENLAALAGRIPGAELALFDGGHLFFVQDRAAWPAIADFLARD